MKTKALMVVAALVVLLLLPGVSHALTNKQKALVGLRGVHVHVGTLSLEAKRLGLTENQIKTGIELRLRKAGVRVLTENWNATLYIIVSTYFKQIGGSTDLCVFASNVALYELVTIDRGFKVSGAVWEAGTAIGTLGTTEDTRFIRELLGDQVDEFINDYLAANPKK